MCKGQQHDDSIIGIWLKFRLEFETCQKWLVINVLSTRSTGFHRRAIVFDLTSFNYQERLPSRWSNKAEKKNILTASQFAGCLALNKTPAVWVTMLCSWIRQSQCPFTVQNEVDTVVKDELLLGSLTVSGLSKSSLRSRQLYCQKRWLILPPFTQESPTDKQPGRL